MFRKPFVLYFSSNKQAEIVSDPTEEFLFQLTDGDAISNFFYLKCMPPLA